MARLLHAAVLAVLLLLVLVLRAAGQGLPLPETLSAEAAVRVLAADYRAVAALPPSAERAPATARLPFDDGPRARRDKETKDRYEAIYQVRRR